jgi:hypothetical protein
MLIGSLLLAMTQASRGDAPAVRPIVVPFELLASRHIAVSIKVNGAGPFRVLFDTGSPLTVLSTKIAREGGLLGPDGQVPAFNLLGGNGQIAVKSLELDGAKAEQVSAVVLDHPTVAAAAKVLGPLEGIVGFSFFARFRLTIDYQAKQLSFVPNGYQPPDVLQSLVTALLAADKTQERQVLAPAGQWGLVVIKDGKDREAGVVVESVLPGGAAAIAGIQKGDRLLTLDGRWTDSVIDTYRAAGTTATAVKVVVRRDGKERELTLRPRHGL